MAEEMDIKTRWEQCHVNGQVYDFYNGSLYHYTTRENLWNIINSNSFYARHVRFSNDSAEYIIGKEEIEKCLDRGELSDLDDCYMVCFCKENDILSQWREYARGGVAIQMDFRNDRIYTIKCNADTEKKKEDPYFIPGGYFNDSIEYNLAYARPIAVKYIQPGKDALKNVVNEIKNYTKEDREMAEDDCLKQLLPYIKHSGFKEEKEVRLVFTVDELNASYLVDYLEDKGMMRPYIRVEVGNAQKRQAEECVIECYKVPNEIKKKIKENLEQDILKIKDPDGKEKQIKICLKGGKTKREEKNRGYIFIENCKYQEYVFQMVDKYVSSYNIDHKNKIRIWCGGYLPIRGITVGPSSDAQELCESITHKIKKKYWMKYVEVNISSIPYRTKV
ncbi:DUF2971 domain-containing protein [Bariatricus sp. SGI.154]|uniref:DUF2971 domain-containing protein n=1 Tax=Bariatricus sp. SGI.154 TaxID=3420549 RepID=UPI003D024364